MTAPRCFVAPASCRCGKCESLATRVGLTRTGSMPRRRHSSHTTRSGRDAVPRRQSLKGISILALGSHRRWLPRVPAPPECPILKGLFKASFAQPAPILHIDTSTVV